MADSREARFAAVAVLDEPTRRRLYDFVVRQPSPVSRDEAAAALGLARATAAFHLDRLADAGLLDVVHERRTGRSGPGAGRPAKLYHRSRQPIEVNLPERRYELAGQLLATAVQESEQSGQSPRTVLDWHARELGTRLGAAARATDPGDSDQAALLRTLEIHGFEPRVADTNILLGNCPFHDLAQKHTELVCGMNLCLLSGMLDGLASTGFTAQLDPGPHLCCVRLAPTNINKTRD